MLYLTRRPPLTKILLDYRNRRMSLSRFFSFALQLSLEQVYDRFVDARTPLDSPDFPAYNSVELLESIKERGA
jgi:hypothetical protein